MLRPVYQIMQLQKLVNMFGGDLMRRYGEKVHKLTLHGGFSCPNRDGTLGRGGCTFCNVASFADEAQQHRSIAEQLAHQAQLVNRAKRYLAYFQAYTSTFAEVQVLRSMYRQAISQANIVGLCVGTRPDCVPEAVLDLLSEYHEQGYEVWLELGLQTAHDKTLHRINRGHDFACYQRTARLARARGLKVCAHLIVGLPGETQGHCLETLERVVATGVDGIKLHPLHIVKGSIMAKAWQAGRLNGIELEAYTVTAGEMIRHTPPEVIYHRISASARRPTLLAPLWCENRWTGMVELDRYLNEQGAQGSALGRSWAVPWRRSRSRRCPGQGRTSLFSHLCLTGFHRHPRGFNHQQHQHGAKRGDSAGENKGAVEFAGGLHDIARDNRPHDAGDAADKMDKAAGAADAGFMHHVLNNRPVDRPGHIEEKDGDRHQQNGRNDAANGTGEPHAERGH